jgi:hypothetical protein
VQRLQRRPRQRVVRRRQPAQRLLVGVAGVPQQRQHRHEVLDELVAVELVGRDAHAVVGRR